jgi:hypothetical protein
VVNFLRLYIPVGLIGKQKLFVKINLGFKAQAKIRKTPINQGVDDGAGRNSYLVLMSELLSTH